MTTYVAMLRGINVGGHQKVSMAALRTLVTDLGHSEVATYIQSGNVVFKSRAGDSTRVARAIEARIKRDLGMSVTVVVRTGAELARVAAANPFLKAGKDAATLYVIFLASAPDAALVKKLDPRAFKPDEFRLIRQEIYAHYPKGYGRSKMTNNVFEGRLNVAGTARNWNTVTRLVQMTSRAKAEK